jgi:hypothetical protein
LATPQEIAHLVLKKVLNARYAWGASLENGPATDCSGFTQFIYRVCGIDLPRSSAAQAQVGRLVARRLDLSRLRPGDLLFFREGGRAVGHVGLYLGEGKMVHASRTSGGVEVSALDRGYYVHNFVAAKRVFKKKPSGPEFAGLSPADSNQDGESCAEVPQPPLPKLRPAPLTRFLLKIFWPWECPWKERLTSLSLSPIDFSSMPDTDHENKQHLVMDLINNPVVA